MTILDTALFSFIKIAETGFQNIYNFGVWNKVIFQKIIYKKLHHWYTNIMIVP